QWYHVAVVHSPPKNVSLYADGTLQNSHTDMNIDFYGLVVGLNRSRSVGTLNWKGYIDEVKVFNRTFSADDVATDCMKSEECSYVPATAPTLSADTRAQAIYLTWNLPGGTDNATIYWRTSGGSYEGTPTAPTASDNVINVADNQTSYLLTGLTGGDYYHFVILANNRNGSSPVSSVVGNVQPTSFVSNILGAENGGICKLQNDNSLHCKGRNILNQLRDGSTANIPGAIDVFGVTNAEAIHYDMNKVSVLKSDSSYQHRGDDDGYGTQSSSVANVTNPIQVEQGYNFVAYLLSDGTIRTRGRNLNGQLGDGTNTDETSGSVQVSGITTATKIAVGTYHACALLTNGQVWCWGNNALGELGDGTTSHRNAPVQASLPSNTAVDITIGSRATGAVMADGSVYVWGDNAGSKLKCNTNENDISTPRNLAAFTNAQKIAIGLNHTVMLSNDGNVYTCGENYNSANVVGNAAFLTAQGATAWVYTNGAVQMDDYQGRVVDIDTDNYNSYMLLDNGSLACIGDNAYGQCNNDGVTTGTDQLTPIIMPDM
ncbi:MAG: LamG-like jellyroll fold domain-containing protein, partial [Candidatus Poseidoniales archaeon]